MGFAPSPASARAVGRPMPEVEPVTRAVLPVRNIQAILSLILSRRRAGEQKLSGEVEGRGAAVDDVAGEQRIVAHGLGYCVEACAPMMLHGRARKFEIG